MDTSDVAKALSAFESGKLPSDVFNQVARLTVTPVVELVAFFRDTDNATKVFLLRRDINDPLWGNMYHVPGSIVLASDAPGSFSDALHRIQTSKLDSVDLTEPRLVDIQLCKVARGTEVAIIYAAELKGRPSEDMLFDLQALPDGMIEGHSEFIAAAVKALF